ncbi:MAG: efflux RND transporter periplasmic adaptor subunit [Sphingomonas sp.]|nr:efflux RND transporter periplasmic adaptor subunit [Sphingomonas sp.]
MEITRETRDRRKLVAFGAAALLAVGSAGVLIGRSMTDGPAPAAGEPAGKAEAGHDREGFVEMTAARVRAAGIGTERLAPSMLATEILAQATVTAPPDGQALLTARADGAVVRISKRLGDAVAAGETVALLESRDAAAFVAARNAAAARERAAHAAWQREQRLFRERITSREDMEAAEAAHDEAEVELRRTEAAVRAAGVTGGGRYLAVRSPIAGRITEMDTQLGAYVTAGAELFNVADPRRIQVDAAVPSTDATRIRPGDRAIVELPGGGTVDAVVRSSTPSLDAESRAATVVLQPLGVPAGLTQGQAVRVRIMPRASATRGVVIAEEAVQQVEGRDVVFVQAEGGFQAVPVTVGQRSGGRVEILEGLAPGVVVVTRGAFVLKSQLGASEAEH